MTYDKMVLICVLQVHKKQGVQKVVKKLVPCKTNGRLLSSGFQALVTLTLTLDCVIRHTVVHQSSTSIYIPNLIEIGKTFFVDGLTAGIPPSSRSCDTKSWTNIKNLAQTNLDIVV